MDDKKRLVVLGSTGSVGTQTLEIVEENPNQFSIFALAAHSNIELLARQAHQFHPRYVAIFDETLAHDLQQNVPKGVEVITKMESLCFLASHAECDVVVSAIVGSVGVQPTYHAAMSGKTIALANKESLVAAGEVIMKAARENGATLLPIDSEHSALFQCLQGAKDHSQLKRLVLTASGGPFLRYSQEELENVTSDQALKHPNWTMGAKVTVDCSTLMNKGFEMIEAYWLFGVHQDKIDVVIHPQSLVHSMVEFVDTSIIAQISSHDMRLPIQYALTYPNRQTSLCQSIDFTQALTLEFLPPDQKKFQCLRLAYQAIGEGGTLPCFMNGVNEVLVDAFLRQEIRWVDIGHLLEELMNRHKNTTNPTLERLLEVDKESRECAKEIVGAFA